MLGELCAMYYDYWSRNRLNEIIILFMFGKLTPEKNLQVNKIISDLTYDFITKKID